MYAVKKLKKQKNIRKVTDILSTSAEVKSFRISLEEKTEKAFEAFAQGKQRVRELAHIKYLD